jgi:glycosyltransferase involved in cell wall biosynthesis
VRITGLTFDRGPNAQYRMFYPLEALAKRGHLVRAATIEELKDWRPLLDTDVLYFWRVYGDMANFIAKQVKALGIPFVWDNDDDVRGITEEHYGHQIFRGVQGLENLRNVHRIMRFADVVTTPSAHLADVYRQQGASDVRVIENFPRRVHAIPRLPTSLAHVTVAWVAAQEHISDLEPLRLVETFKELLDRHRTLRIVTVGLGLPVPSDRYIYVENVPFKELRNFLADVDVGIAPIADSAFSWARSNVKLKEYASAGAPWLASPIGPYAGMGEEQGGRLVEDDGWVEAIEELITDPAARRRLSKNAISWAKTQTIFENAEAWETVFEDALARVAGASAK